MWQASQKCNCFNSKWYLLVFMALHVLVCMPDRASSSRDGVLGIYFQILTRALLSSWKVWSLRLFVSAQCKRTGSFSIILCLLNHSNSVVPTAMMGSLVTEVSAALHLSCSLALKLLLAVCHLWLQQVTCYVQSHIAKILTCLLHSAQ